MSATLLLLLGADLSAPIRWARIEAGDVAASGVAANADELAQAAAAAGEVAGAVALLPGETVAVRRMPQGPKDRAKLKTAARYLMEDELAEAGDALEVSVAHGRDLAVAYAARAEIIRGWLAAFARAGVECDVLSADFLALPSTAEDASILVDGGRVVAAFAGVGFAAEADLFGSLAPEIFAGGPALFRVIGEDDVALHLPASAARDWLGPADETAILRQYAAALAAAPPPNFLRKPLFRKRAILAAAAPWRRAGLIGAGLAATLAVFLAGDALRAMRVEGSWNAATREVFARAFPEAAGEDPAAFARRRLEDGGGASFVALASRMSAALGSNEDVEITRLRFDSGRAEMIVSVRTTSDGAIEGFKAALAESGLAAQDSGGFRRDGEFWAGDLSARLR